MRHTHTHTYAILDLGTAAYNEIKAKLEAAGYQDQFHEEQGRIVIDMHGIAVAEDPQQAKERKVKELVGSGYVLCIPEPEWIKGRPCQAKTSICMLVDPHHGRPQIEVDVLTASNAAFGLYALTKEGSNHRIGWKDLKGLPGEGYCHYVCVQ